MYQTHLSDWYFEHFLLNLLDNIVFADRWSSSDHQHLQSWLLDSSTGLGTRPVSNSLFWNGENTLGENKNDPVRNLTVDGPELVQNQSAAGIIFLSQHSFGSLWCDYRVSNDRGVDFLNSLKFQQHSFAVIPFLEIISLQFLHMPWQLCCHGMCKILWWSFC